MGNGRLLIFELHHLGDAVLALPFVNAAAEKFDVAVCCRPAAAEIFALARRPPTIFPWRPAWENGGGLPEEVAKWRAEAAVCAWPDTRVHWLMRRCGIARRIGFPAVRRNFIGLNRPWRRRRCWQGRAVEWLMKAAGMRLLTTELRREDYFQHHMENWRQLAASLGLSFDLTPPWLRADGVPRGALPRWVVHPGGRLPTKRWPWERLEQVIAERLAGRAEVVVIRPPDAGDLLAGYAGTTVETPTFAALADTIASADAVLCNDSLAAHVAAALGKPTVTIFGSGEPRWFAPVGPGHEIVRRAVCPLHPCIDRCEMPSVICLEAVTTADVGAAVERLQRRLGG